MTGEVRRDVAASPVKHPAPYSWELIPVFANLLDKYRSGLLILDPMAGIGRVHELRSYGYSTYGVELEPEWAIQSPYTVVGDATKLPFKYATVDTICVSPAYGNRMADCHRAMDNSYRRTYTHVLGRQLTDNNSGAMQWGEPYRQLHRDAWAEASRVLKGDGLFLLNVKDHIRKGRRQRVSLWHLLTLKGLGFEILHHEVIGTPGFLYGENRDLRLPENVVVLRKTR